MDLSASRGDVIAWLQLTLAPGVSPGALRALLGALGTPQDVLAAGASAIAAVAGDEVARAIGVGADERLLSRSLDWIERPGNHFVALGDPDYPPMLLEIPDPPPAFYARGRLDALRAPAIAIVGSRNATPQGVRDARAFAHALSDAGYTIVSGLALGIDAAAHRGGLDGASSSVAVMGTGPERLYPPRNRELGEELAIKGCVMSEFPLGCPPHPWNFPRRNRLISGLSRGVLIMEAATQSGSLWTAHFALEQNREIFVVPGSIHAPHSKGCHRLLKEGAALVEEPADVLEGLGHRHDHGAAASVGQPRERDPILAAIGHSPASIDEIAERSGLDAAKLAARLSRLEIEGRVEALAGGRFQRVERR